MKIINKKSFYYGILLSFALAFVYYTFSENSGRTAASTGGVPFHLWSWQLKVLTFVPGFLLIFHGLFPNTSLGKAGGVIFRLYSWVQKQNKKR
jgi:hypothetical protein